MDSDTLRWIMLACFVLGSIFFLVITILGYKSWRVLHILAAIFMFACAATFAVYFALLTKATLAWKEVVETNRKAAEQQEQRLNDFVYGEPGPRFAEDSVVGVSRRLGRELVGRGRVWRKAIGQFNGNQLTLQLAAPEVIEGREAPPTPTIETSSPIYIFTEQEVNVDGSLYPVPQRYLGEFTVTAATGSTISLDPILVFYQPGEFGGAVELVAYEKMPGDNHDVLQTLREQTNDPVEFRNKLTQEIFPPQYFGLDPTLVDPTNPTRNQDLAARYERLIDQYQFDGMELGEIDDALEAMSGSLARIRPGFNPPPEELWVTVELLQDYSVQVNAENPGGDEDIRRLAVNRGYYDSRGLAISADLRLSTDEVELKKGDVVMIDNVTATLGYASAEEGGVPYQSWQAQGLIDDPTATTYFRPLNDYQLALQELNLAQNRIARDIASLEVQIAGTAETLLGSERLLTAETNEQERLRLDLDSVLEDQRIVSLYEGELSALLSARRQRVNALYVQVQSLAARKAELEAELVRRIDQATAAAVTAQ